MDEILSTGISLEIDRGGKRLRIVPVEGIDKLQSLLRRRDVILGTHQDHLK